MLKHSRFSILSHFVLLFCLSSFLQGAQDDMIGDNFIQTYLYCSPYDLEYRKSSTYDHYFRMFTIKGKNSPPTSFSDIAQAGELMLEEWLRSTSQMMATFREEYMNLNLYTDRFMDDRFNPMVNLVWKELQIMFGNPSRFSDWVEKREVWMNFNEFTNLVDAQKPLIEEFSSMDSSLFEAWADNFPNIMGEVQINTGEAFQVMKNQTVTYLALIFMAAFEYQRDETFYTKDNVLEEFWRVFLPWLELNQCNHLVNAALNGMLPQVTNVGILQKLMNTNIQSQNLDAIRLHFDSSALQQFSAVIPEVAFLSKLGGKWSFYTEENINEIIDMTEDDSVDERIEFDKIRIENPQNCLDFVATLDAFTSMRQVFKLKNKYMMDTYYYFFIEYLNLRIKDKNEFKDQVRARRAVQIIYVFLNKILDEDSEQMKKDTPSNNIVHIILKILNGLGEEGNLRDLLPTNVLDKDTEDYIYMLFLIVTESNDLPKPTDSGELDRARENSVVDDQEDDPSFRIDPRNPKFAYVIRRLYMLAGNANSAGLKYVKRYHKKYFNADLLQNNLIFMLDDKFYQLELAMNKEFSSGEWDFETTKSAYDNAKEEYFNQAIKQGKNIHIMMLVKFFANELQKYKTLKVPSNVDEKMYKKAKYDELFLSHLAELKSNFMEIQYVEAIMMAKATFKIPLPDFEYLLSNKMRDNDRLNLFEFMKRVITNIKYNRSNNASIMLDTMDVNTTIYDDHSHVDNGERFHTMLLDITYFFRPEMDRLIKKGVSTGEARLQYNDLNDTMRNIDNQFNLLKKQPEIKTLRDFRLMMTWNIFDDIEEYLPLLGKFIEETKAQDMQGSNNLKMEMLVENYTNLYVAILEHRLFAAKNGFSFDSPKGRAINLLAYLRFINDQYDEMFANPLPDKEMRFSKLDSRQIENLIYFLNYRFKVVLEQQGEDSSIIQLSHTYFPFAFREIYALVDNHHEIRIVLEKECEAFMVTFETEKSLRAQNYEETTFTEEERNAPGFKFCMLIRFNRDMNGLIENQAKKNADRDVMLTITRESIFQELVVPYYDKMDAHELIIQVFNLNMSHAKAAARESAEKFSNYIALLDAFLLILDDLEDGVNDTLNVENLGSGQISTLLRNFCLKLEKTDQPENKSDNMVFIRHLLLEKLLPKFLAPGANLRKIYDEYTVLPVNMGNVNKYSGRLRYGPIKESKVIDLNVEGADIDTELVALLMIYSPHSEFTAETLYDNNFMSKLPKYLRMAEDNQGYMYKNYPNVSSMDQVFEIAYTRKMDMIKHAEKDVDEEINISLNDEFDFDLGLGNMGDEQMDHANSMWESEIIEIDQSSIESNVKKVDEISRILVDESVTKIELTSQQSALENQTLFIDEIIKTSNGGRKTETSQLLQSMESSLESSQMNFNGVNIVSDRLDFAETSLESKNFDRVDSKNGKSKTIIRDNNLSLADEFTNQVVEDRIKSNVSSVCKFKIAINNVGDTKKLQMLEAAAKKIATQMNVDNYKVHVSGSNVDSSQKLETKMTTHVSQEIRAFDTANKQLHVSGGNDAKLVMIQSGQVTPMQISTTKFNGAMNSVEAKAQINQLISTGISKIASRSKSFNQPSTTKKVVVKSSSNSSKFLRLV